ncbi:hypothetical protein Q5P01_019247 [Channa striata]|uniref:F-box protein 40 n=1 Tax=Channa striata TaxID=64152 RepID=A0AA88M3L7_CHASR|nr:hypothetical protein Q5P01_019247 [Channa striata]
MLWHLDLQILIEIPVDMSHRSRSFRVQQHVHCDSCYSRRCRARVEVSVCCAVTPCRLHCGALFHLCKEQDHLLLCPNVRVPCLNAGYGCPVQLPRSAQAAHLQVCPASVVCCSIEWLRWPTDDTNPNCSIVLQENVLKGNKAEGEALDVAMALVDQSDLFHRLRMKPLYPELMEEEEEEEEEKEEEIKEEKKAEIAIGGMVNGVAENDPHEESSLCENNFAQETARMSASQRLSLIREKHSLTEMMFGMERRSCAVAEASLENDTPSPKPPEKGKAQTGTADKQTEKDGVATPDTSKTGLAPWQEGVLERLGQELTPQEYNMYMVHHGRMLLAFGQIEACTSREKDFVYGNLEPIPVQTLRSFKVPDSYHYRQRAHLYNTAARAQTQTASVDTSDLGANEQDWFCDEAAATLLGYAENEVMGHKISESKAADGLYVDVGTQTHSFRSAPFKGKMTLAEVTTVDRPLKLHLQLQAESVNSRHNSTCVFSFRCGHTFHRREFPTHCRNVHSDIQTGLSGWFEQRCPLAYLGCTYSQRRFQPSTHRAALQLASDPRTIPDDGFQPPKGSADLSAAQRKGGAHDSLSSLPFEVLRHTASFLDSLSLSQLALVSRLMRQVCTSLLQERGMVTLRWEKTGTRRGSNWKAKPVWEFSHLFSSVDLWHMADTPPISAHLKVCPYYDTSERSEPVPLPSMSEKLESSQERRSLVNHFRGNRLKQ